MNKNQLQKNKNSHQMKRKWYQKNFINLSDEQFWISREYKFPFWYCSNNKKPSTDIIIYSSYHKIPSLNSSIYSLHRYFYCQDVYMLFTKHHFHKHTQCKITDKIYLSSNFTKTVYCSFIFSNSISRSLLSVLTSIKTFDDI